MPPSPHCETSSLPKEIRSSLPQNQTCDDPSFRPKTLHVAPMLNYSNREFRQLLRILSKRCVLWTEMVVDETVAYTTKLEEQLGFDSNTHPIVCQIGGNSPDLCGKATIVVERYGYDEINLNIDCPSDRVCCEREFGAVLMTKVDTALAVLEAMRNSAQDIPVSVKTRIGVDDWDDLEFTAGFIRRLSPVCKRFVMHARKCVLGGLMNARQNRSIPPLNYPRVYALCNMFPDCEFWINGGIHCLKEARLIAYGAGGLESAEQKKENNTGLHLQAEQHSVPCPLCNYSNGSCTAPPAIAPPNLRGVMLGRAAMDNPAIFFDVDRYFYGEQSNPCKNRREVLERYCEYLERTYQRRCCDSDERITFMIPTPDVVHESEYCSICAEVYSDGKRNNNLANADYVSPNRGKRTKAKIASRIIARSLKPVQGIFLNVPKSRQFRRTCDELGRNMEVRNCGPGFMLRKAMQCIPADILDRDFVKTEDL